MTKSVLTSFCGKTRLLLAVGETLCVFNTGAGAQIGIMEARVLKLLGLIQQTC